VLHRTGGIMATVIYLTSLEPAGKTALGVAMGKDLIKRGKKIGYFIPVVLQKDGEKKYHDDTSFVKEILELEDDVNKISPMHYTSMQLWNNLSTDTTEFDYNLKTAFKVIATGKDVIITEGLCGLVNDATATLLCYRVAEQLDARVVILLRYADTLKPDVLNRVKAELKDRLVGVIINYIPESKMSIVREKFPALFAASGLKVLGMIPESRTLLGVTVAEIARDLNGEVLTAKEKLGELVENVMMGSMTLDSGISYFSRKPNKAVLVNSERSDMQLAAMETSTLCLVVAGNTPLLEQVIHHSEVRRVPLIMVKEDLPTVINELEKIFDDNVFNNAKKLKHFQQLTTAAVDYNGLYAATGVLN
jgi:BioD-like phosphotransacetylase family protein